MVVAVAACVCELASYTSSDPVFSLLLVESASQIERSHEFTDNNKHSYCCCDCDDEGSTNALTV